MMNLALGSLTEYGFDWSVHVARDAYAHQIAQVLQEWTKGNNCCGTDAGLWPDTILMIENGEKGPVVFTRYHAGIDYPREGQAHLVDWKENHVTPKRV